jgi:hypothetical protein
MTPELIAFYLRPFHNISDEALQYLATQFEEVKYPAKHIYLHEGEPCKKEGIFTRDWCAIFSSAMVENAPLGSMRRVVLRHSLILFYAIAAFRVNRIFGRDDPF